MFLLSDENMESARKRREWNHNHALVPWRISPWRSISPFDAFKQKTLQRTPVAPLKTNLAATEFGLKIGEQRCGTAMVPEGSGFRLGICQSRYFSLFRLAAPMFLGS